MSEWKREGYSQLVTARVYVTDKEIIIAGQPDEFTPHHEDEDGHNCDANGCGIDHVIARFPRPKDVRTVSEICRKMKWQACGNCERWECGDNTHPEKH